MPGRPSGASAVLVRALSNTGRETTELDGLAEAVGQSLGTRWCELSLTSASLGVCSFHWPTGTAAAGVRIPVRFRGEQVGFVGFDAAGAASLTRGRRRLLNDVTGVLGPILYSARLGLELQAQLRTAQGHAERIAASHRRAFMERDAERRALERNLHDGAQHHLVVLRMTVGLLEHELAIGAVDEARQRLDQITAQLNRAEQLLLSTAAGILPLALVDGGLVPALANEFHSATATVRFDVGSGVAGRRYPFAVETAVYFSCLEAVNNAYKHAPGAAVHVELQNDYRGLGFAIRDDGPGFSGDLVTTSGVRNMRDRLEAVGGELSVRSSAAGGTTVSGFIPL